MRYRLGVPRRLRTVVLVLVLLLMHVFVPELVESCRLFLIRGTSAPLEWTGRSGSSPLDLFTATERAWLTGARTEFRRRASSRTGTANLLPVLDLDGKSGRLILGGGRNLGVRRNALVYRGDTCLGVVDRVEAHLSRVRLLYSKRTSLPVRIQDPGRELPGGLDELHGVLVGDGEEAFLASTFLPEAFRPGDTLVTEGREGMPSHPVGAVATSGVRPRVRLLAEPSGVSVLLVDGIKRPAETAALFENRRFDLLFRSGGRDPVAVICGAGARHLLPGSAIHRGGWFLGMVTSTGPGAAAVNPASHKGQTLTVRVITEDLQSHAAILEGRGGGRARVQRWLDTRPRTGPVLVATAGGQQLVPPWLVVGRGTYDGERLNLRVPARWPSEVEVAVFRHGAERRLLAGSRR